MSATSPEQAAEHLLQRINARDSKQLGIQAPPGFGKTTVLLLLAAALTHNTTRPVLQLGLPDSDDAAQVVLVDAATQLVPGRADLLDRVVPRQEPAKVSWASKHQEVQKAIRRAGDDLVILLDNPRFYAAEGPEGELFSERAAEITKTVLRSQATVVLAGPRLPQYLVDQDISRHLEPLVAQQVRRALRAAGIDVWQAPVPDLRALTRQLWRAYAQAPDVQRVFARLSSLRVPFSDELLMRAGVRDLSSQKQDLIELLVQVLPDGRKIIPDALAQQIRGLAVDLATEAHRFAAAYHHERFEAARSRGNVAVAVREEMEEIHHLTEAADAAALLDRSLQFVEQYDALGKRLSLKALTAASVAQGESLRYDAIRAYERAIAHDTRDAYAHHYIAYNLDILGAEPQRVEHEYKAALDIKPGHSWYHSRYICFLVTRVWTKEARDAWSRALSDLEENQSLLPGVYEKLHGQLARLLLSRGELEFAQEVLDDVPPEQRDPWWHALEQVRVCLEEDRDERLVFPPTLALAKRWEGPHLADDREVSNWKPARVFGVDEEGVTLLLAAQTESHSTLRLSTGDLEQWNVLPGQLEVGTFVELIEYADETKAMKIWDSQSASFDAVPHLPGLFPLPDRYIRRAFA